MIGFNNTQIDVRNGELDVLYNGFLFLYDTKLVQITIDNIMTISLRNEENSDSESSLSLSGTTNHLDIIFYNLSKSSVTFSHTPARIGSLNNRELLIGLFLNSRYKDSESNIYLLHYCLYLGNQIKSQEE